MMNSVYQVIVARAVLSVGLVGCFFLAAACLAAPTSAQDTVDRTVAQEAELNASDAQPNGTPKSGEAQQLYDDGVKALNAGDSATAVSLLEKAAQAQPRNAQIRFALAMACIQDEKTGKAWFHLRRAVLLNPRHQRAIQQFMRFWRTVERRGAVNVGTRAEEVQAVAGSPDRMGEAGDKKRWLYGFMAVNFVDDRVDSVMDMRGLDPKASTDTETLSFETDDREWQLGYRFIGRNQSSSTYFLPNETPQKWTERFVIQRLTSAAQDGAIAPQASRQVEAGIKRLDPEAKWSVLEESDSAVLYEWQISGTDNRPPQHGIARLIGGKKDGHRMSYVARSEQMPDEKRRQWIDLLKQATVVAGDDEASGDADDGESTE